MRDPRLLKRLTAAAGFQARNNTFKSTHLCPCFLVSAARCGGMAFEVQYLPGLPEWERNFTQRALRLGIWDGIFQNNLKRGQFKFSGEA